MQQTTEIINPQQIKSDINEGSIHQNADSNVDDEYAVRHLLIYVF